MLKRVLRSERLCHGFGYSNFPDDVVAQLPHELRCGVYYGWGQVEGGPVHEMVMSVGWNPFYHNTKRTMETHIMHDFDEDFYGKELRVCVAGHIRPMANFSGVDELIAAIQDDILQAKENLSREDVQAFKKHSFFSKYDQNIG